MNSTTLGACAEDEALAHLTHAGLRLVTRNTRSRRGEIDLVMQDGGTLVFVEVRSRRNTRFGHPAETVDLRKQARLRATAQLFLQAHRGLAGCPCRFDVVALTREPAQLSWIRDAF